MDRETDDREEPEKKEQDENVEESEEDSETDQHTLFMRKLSSEIERQRQGAGDDAIASAAEEIRRMYENSIAGIHHIPPAHRPVSCTSNSGATAPFFGQNLTNDRLFQFSLGGYLPQHPSSPYQPYALPNMQSPLMQNQNFQTVPSGISSPHVAPYQQKPSPTHSFGRSPTNYQSPPPAHARQRRSASLSSRHSREESTSPVVQNSWSFEEQFKQLYDIDRDDPKRKEFLDDLFSFMQKHETPVTRLPIMAKSVLDLYELYKLVVQRGGLVDVINKKLWQEVIKGLNLPSSITSAAFTLRTQYMKFLYRYECAKLNLSTMSELQAAIEGNKREGRRTSYPYGDIQQQMQQTVSQHNVASNSAIVNNVNASAASHLMSSQTLHSVRQPQMSPVSLVSSSASVSNVKAAQINGHHSSIFNAGHGSVPPMSTTHGISPLVLQGASVPISTEARILEYIKLMSSRMMQTPPINGPGTSPEIADVSPNLSNVDVTQLALWNLYNGVLKPPLQQNPIMAPFQTPVNAVVGVSSTQSETNNEAPLDLGKRKSDVLDDDSGDASPLSSKKQSLDNADEPQEADEASVSGTESNEDPDKNSSQVQDTFSSYKPVVVKMKINGMKYKGVLHPMLPATNRKVDSTQ